jgi:nucleoside-diphosphate-sugar epimerase
VIDRRDILLGTLAAAACGTVAKTSSSPPPPPPQPQKKSILILGGTNFLGPHVVTAALARGHTVTLFNRGKTNPGLFPELEKLHGDRDGHLEALRDRRWDAVVDPSGYVPRIVKMSAELLAPNVGHYVFISTISVYDKEDRIDPDESLATTKLDEPGSEDVKKHYGALKALCEQAAEAAMPGRVATIRPGLIIGPGDPTGRFTHWPTRLAEGGDVLAPGDGSTPTQYIDGRDLGAWIVKVIEDRTVGTYNALGPATRITMRECLDACNHAIGDRAKLVWVDAKFLDEHEVSGWSEMPMWLDNKGDYLGFGTLANARAVAKGLGFRPVAETAKDTLAWLDSLPADERAKVRDSGIKPEKEREVIAAWKARGTTGP